MVTYTNEQVLLQGAAKSVSNGQMWGSLSVQGEGSGYTSPPSVSITEGGGSGATATSKLKVTGIIVTACGSGYTSAPQVEFSSGGGSGATAEATVNTNGQVTEISVTNVGSDYTSVPSISITGGGGSGATAQAIMSVGRVDIGNQGSGYTAHPTVTLSAPPSGGVTATAYAKAHNGIIESIYVAGDMNALKNSSVLTFKDSETGMASDMFVLTSYDNHNSPILTFTQGVMMEKDLIVGGFLDSGQGALWLNHGLKGRPILSTPPCIQMMSSGVYYPSDGTLPSNPETGQLFNHSGTKKMWDGSQWITGNFTGIYDTLFLFQSDGITRAHLDLGNLTTHGPTTIIPALINLYDTNVRIYRDINDSTQAYRDSIRVQTPTDGGLIVEQNLWCNSLAVDTNIGISGTYIQVQENCITREALNNFQIRNNWDKATDTRADTNYASWALALEGNEFSIYKNSGSWLKLLNLNASGNLTILNDLYVGTTNTGKIFLGADINGAWDVNLYRSAVNTLRTDDAFEFQPSTNTLGVKLYATNIWSFYSNYNSGVYPFMIQPSNNIVRIGDGFKLSWGQLGYADDTNLYRSAVDVLKTDDNFIVGNATLNLNPPSGNPVFNLQKADSTKGFFGSNGSKTYVTAAVGDLEFNATGGVITAVNDFVAQGLININNATPTINFQISTTNKGQIGVDVSEQFYVSAMGSGALLLGASSGEVSVNGANLNIDSNKVLRFGLVGYNPAQITYQYNNDISQGCIQTLNLVPPANNTGYIGTVNCHFDKILANYLEYDVSHDLFDSLDDLTLVRNYTSKTVKRDGIDVDVIDDESLSFLRNEDGFFTPNRVNGFLLGCVKALVLRLETLENQVMEGN